MNAAAHLTEKLLKIPARLEKAFPNDIGYFYNILSQFFYSTFQLMIKTLPTVPSFQLGWFRSTFLMLSAYSVFRMRGQSVPVKSPKVNTILLLRGLTGFLSNALLFYGLRYAPLGEGIVVMEMYPAIAALLSVFLLGEKYTLTQFLYTIFCIAGAALIIKPGFLFPADELTTPDAARYIGLISIFGSAFTVALSVVIVRKQALSKVDTLTGMFYTGFVQMALFPVAMLFQGAKAVTLVEFGKMMVLGVLGMIAQYMFNHSLHFGDASKISLMGYSEMIFGYLLDIVVLGTQPDMFSIIGSIMIFSCVFVQMYDLSKKRK